MAICVEHKSKVSSPASVMVTFPNEWKILKWDEKPQTNKQIKQKPHLSQSAAPMQAFLGYWYER